MISIPRIPSCAVVRASVFGFAILGLAGPAAQKSVAALFTLADDNASASFQTASGDNNFNWTVDGVNQMSQQAFWYRVGDAPEQLLHGLPIAVQGTTDTNFNGNPDTLFVRYNGAGFQADMRYGLDGGTGGSGAADMSEQISIVNVTNEPLSFHFFQYTDFDVRGTAGDDSAVFTNANAVDQFEGSARFTETVVTPVPSHREIAFFPTTRNKLNDGLPTTLSDTPIGSVIGPGNLTWAYQWDVVIPPGSTFQISKDKDIRAVPEPAATVLVGIALGLLAARRQRRPII
jgi:hypothetical protein